MIFKKGQGKKLRKLWELTSVGFVIPVSIAVGLTIGYYLDKLFKTFPWLTVIFTLFGIAAGFYSMLDMIKKSG